MSDVARLGKDELLAKYSDGHVLQRLLNLAQLTEFLKDSILKADYRMPDQLNDAIVLSPHGKRIHQELITKNDVPAKEVIVSSMLPIGFSSTWRRAPTAGLVADGSRRSQATPMACKIGEVREQGPNRAKWTQTWHLLCQSGMSSRLASGWAATANTARSS
jgi:hypothetical protein